jgi:aromatic-L-amino-acid decarboxylase
MDFGIQLGRRFRALKAWTTFRSFGRSGIENRIREHCRLAREFTTFVEETADFVLAAPTVMAVVCFRFHPPAFDDTTVDLVNEEIAETVNAGGKAYITHTRLNGRTALRVGIGNISTTSAHLCLVWEQIKLAARKVASMRLAASISNESMSTADVQE